MGACCSALLEPPEAARDGEAPGAAPGIGAALFSAATAAAPMLLQQAQVLIHPANQNVDPAVKDAVDQKVAELDDGANIMTSTCTGNKKSLFVGINYFGSRSELHGCLNDVRNVQQFVVEKFGFPTDSEHMLVLTDDQKDPAKIPNRANMLAGMQWLVAGAQNGDSLFFHYSGHGGSQKDANSDEADAADETLVPVDYESAGQIVDDELHELLVANLPEGVRLTAVMDCCHSGSVFDLPYTYGMTAENSVVEKDNRAAAIAAALSAGMSLIMGKRDIAFAQGKEALGLFMTPAGPAAPPAAGSTYSTHAGSVKIKTSVADVIQFSGCKDEQTSADAQMGGSACGAMSWALIKAFNEKGMEQTYVDLLANTRENLTNSKFQQVPQLSSGHRMKMGVKFIM